MLATTTYTYVFNHLDPNLTLFGSFSPSKHGHDESCANFLEAGEFTLERLAALIVGLDLPVGENGEDVTMTFQSIADLFMVNIDDVFEIQACIDEANRRRRMRGASEIPWDLMPELYKKSHQYFEHMLSNDCRVEHDARVNEGEARTWPFTTDDTVYLAEAVKLILDTDINDDIFNNLRDILVTLELHPKLFRTKNLSETAAVLDLWMWMSLVPEESVPNERRDYGPPEDVVTKVLQFVFPDEYFTENTKKGKRVTTSTHTETEQSGNGGMDADVDTDQGNVRDVVMGNQQLPPPPPLFSVPWCTGIQPAQEDDMSLGSKLPESQQYTDEEMAADSVVNEFGTFFNEEEEEGEDEMNNINVDNKQVAAAIDEQYKDNNLVPDSNSAYNVGYGC